ncbi:MAG TPA: hypothetical protein VIC27_07365, partial [Ktedonobacterales bacterium]
YTGTSSHLRALIDSVAKRLDMYAVMLLVVVVAILAVRRLRLTIAARDVWALLAIAMLATPMLSKQVWPYYYLEPLVFIVVWELSTLQDRVAGVWRWPVLSISFTLVAGTLSQYVGLQSVGRLDALVVGVTQTALMAGFALGVWARIQARKPTAGSADVAGYAVAGMQPMTPPGMAVAGAASFSSGQAGPMAPPARDGRDAAMRPQPQQPQQPQQQGERRPARQPGPYGQGQTPPPPGSAGGALDAPPAWLTGGAPSSGAAPGAATPLWPSDAVPPGAANAQEWRGPAPAMPTPRSPQGGPGGPAPRPPARPPAQGPAQGPGAAPPPDGVADPWRDWPQRR